MVSGGEGNSLVGFWGVAQALGTVDYVRQFLEIVLHLNRHLDQLVGEHGPWVYAILFVIVFCETGLVVTPFLPGDSLLFAAGAVSAGGRLNPFLVGLVLLSAALAGDNVNYWVGRLAGRALPRRFPRLIRREHIERTHRFFERYGGKTVIIARFVPVVRTFTPFVAGAGAMDYVRFLGYSVAGAVLWVAVCGGAGYFFGNLPFVQRNFSAVILAIIVVSVLPAVVEFVRERRRMAPRPPR